MLSFQPSGVNFVQLFQFQKGPLVLKTRQRYDEPIYP